ncbi:unnamed protein product [Camellia sinensis]
MPYQTPMAYMVPANEKVDKQNLTTICGWVHNSVRSSGVFHGDNPMMFAGPVLLVQLGISSLLTAILQFLLNPLGETAFISQSLVGMALGPSFLSNGSIRSIIFPPQSLYISETFAYFGLMLFLFLVGVKMDLGIIRKSGRRAVVIGVCNFFIPLALNEALAFILRRTIPMDQTLYTSLPWIASFQCLTSFYVSACVLDDLHLLNSELGRLALPASMISGLCNWSWTLITFTARKTLMAGGGQHMLLLVGFLVICMIAIIIYVLKPLMLWMVRQTGDDETVRESYIFGIFVMVLGCSMLGEIIGQHFLVGPMILGLAVPEGPPLGTALVTKLDTYVSTILLPIYFVVNGSRIDFSLIHLKTFGIVQLMGVFGLMCKLIGTILSSFYCELPLNDAVSLGLVMSVQGITDVLFIGFASRLQYINEEEYNILVLSAIFFGAAITPILKAIYKPSKRYIAYKRRTIEHTKPGSELRMLACIHQEDQTPSLINLLESSNPSSKSPIFFYLIHLIELSGRSAPILVVHRVGKRSSMHSHQSDHIINAFRLYEQQNQGAVMVNPYTTISPYATMHDEVCALALDRKVSLIILPFHKFLTIHGAEESNNSIRIVNRNILRAAPCSVGILVERGTLGSSSHNMKSNTAFNIGVIFLGGQDDREALAYANRMAEHPNVNLMVVHLVEYSTKKYKMTWDMQQDFELINEFKIATTCNKYFVYKEEVVYDSVEVIGIIRTLDSCFDLILVGRHHHSASQLLPGLTEWNEFPELGYIGDMLASSDSSCKASVLVVQQQVFVGGDILDSPMCVIGGSFSVVDVPWDNAKVCPAPHYSREFGK